MQCCFLYFNINNSATSAETVEVEDFHPIQPEMRITFNYMVGHIIKTDNHEV